MLRVRKVLVVLMATKDYRVLRGLKVQSAHRVAVVRKATKACKVHRA